MLWLDTQTKNLLCLPGLGICEACAGDLSLAEIGQPVVVKFTLWLRQLPEDDSPMNGTVHLQATFRH